MGTVTQLRGVSFRQASVCRQIWFRNWLPMSQK